MFDGLRDVCKRYSEAFRAAWADRDQNKISKRRRQESDFLPAMLEIQETPPPPIAHITMWLIIILFSIAIVWMIVGRIDIVATATGKILPDSRIKIVQSAQSGIVKSIRVKDGDHVAAGEVLLELDSTANSADKNNLQHEWESNRLEAEMTRLLIDADLAAAPPALRDNTALADISDSRLITQQENLNNLFLEQKSRQRQIQDDIKSLRADLIIEEQGVINSRAQLQQSKHAGAQRLQGERYQIEKIQTLLPIAEDEYTSFQSLYDKNIVSRLQVQQAQEKLLSLQKDLLYRQNQLEEIRTASDTEQMEHTQRAEQYESRIHSLNVRIAGKKQSLTVEETRFRREMNERHSAALRKINELEQQLIKAQQLEEFHQIIAPADGIVQQMKIHTQNAVIQAAEALLVIVPHDRALEVEAFIANKDIGFVHVGQPVEIKIDAFPYTKFGLLHGTVSDISADAIEDEKRGLIYQTKIKLHDNSLIVEGREKALSPGMSVVAEIKTGQRRIIEFFMAPLIQHGKESLGER